MIGLSVYDHLDLFFCLVRRHGPDGYLLVVAVSGSFSFLSSPSSLQVALLSLLIDSFNFFYINLWSIAETFKSRCSIPSLWTVSIAISPLTWRYVFFEKHLWLASRVTSPSWRYTLSDNHETIAIETPEDQSHDRSRDKFVTIYTTSSNLIYPESMSDMQGSTGAPAPAEKALPGPGPAPAKIGQITGDLTEDFHFGVLFLNCKIYLKTINI